MYYLPKNGDIISGRYLITRELGRGGFGAVFVATQIGLNRQVAVKVLLPSAAIDQIQTERFAREVQLVRELVHPNTIRIYDFGKTEGGLLYFAMEYLDGQSLLSAMNEGPVFSEERTVVIIEQLLGTLIEAHNKGIIHRDLKPENIMLLKILGVEHDFVKVLDFGIAKVVGVGSDEFAVLTLNSQGMGTPRYMAPEILKNEQLGPWSDIYSVGLMMIEMLSGKPALSGNLPMDIILTNMSEDPLDLPVEVTRCRLVDVIRKATQKSPFERYQSAQEFLDELRAAIKEPKSQPKNNGPGDEEFVNTIKMGLLNDSLQGDLRGKSEPGNSKWTCMILLLLTLLFAFGSLSIFFYFKYHY